MPHVLSLFLFSFLSLLAVKLFHLVLWLLLLSIGMPTSQILSLGQISLLTLSLPLDFQLNTSQSQILVPHISYLYSHFSFPSQWNENSILSVAQNTKFGITHNLLLPLSPYMQFINIAVLYGRSKIKVANCYHSRLIFPLPII